MKVPTSPSVVVSQTRETRGNREDECSEMKSNSPNPINIHLAQVNPRNSLPAMKPKSAFILLFNAIIIVGFGILAYSSKYFQKPVQRGFHCGDLSIRYPFKESTVPIGSLLLVGNASTLVAIILGEFFYHRRKFEPLSQVYQLFDQLLHPSFVRFAQFFLASVAGFTVNIWLVYMVKYNLGQLRPHFLDVCRPNVNYMSCSATQYFENYTCTTSGTEPARKLYDARLSFYSGHTSAAFYFASFLWIGRFEYSWTPLFVLLYTIVLTAASLVGISRILDNKHHNSDVVVGALVGTSIAACVLYCNKHLVGNAETTALVETHDHVYEKDQKKKKVSAGSTQNSNNANLPSPENVCFLRDFDLCYRHLMCGYILDLQYSIYKDGFKHRSIPFLCPLFISMVQHLLMSICFPVFLLYNKLRNNINSKQSFIDASVVFGDYGLTIRKCSSFYLSSNTLIVGILSWLLLKEKLTVAKCLAVVFAIAGVVIISMDKDFAASLMGVCLALISAFTAAIYKVGFKLIVGNATLSQVSLFMSCLGIFNMLLNFAPTVVFIATGLDHFEWEFVPWLPLMGAAILAMGMLFGLPLNTAIDILFRDMTATPTFLVGASLLLISFVLAALPVEELIKNIVCGKKEKVQISGNEMS
uniref:Phosphatidic acid phosphatase type 2/haloperoxidase domain-containing protein n=1 Tax=Ditylenchus dipsaci TaxID=166011 RepID=A0A915E8W5_9BILA